ncbi:MAG: MFS transporter [Aestuariivirga sp.]
MTDTGIQRSTDWPAIIVLFLGGLVAAMQFAKVAPVMELVGGELGLDPVASGFAVSILGLVGILFAITVGAIVSAIGPQRGLLIALFGGAVIAGLGALAPTGVTFLVSRFCEGFSHLLIVVCAPALMAALAAPKDKPVALAIWGCFFGLGFAVASAAAPIIVPLGGWRGFLLCHAAAMLVIGLLVMLLLARSKLEDQRGGFPGVKTIAAAHAALFRERAPLLLALTFCAYTIQFLATLTFLTLYLGTEGQWRPASVGSFMAFASFVSLIFTLSAGFLARWGVTLFQGFAAAFAGLAVTATIIFGFHPGAPVLVAAVLVMMACFGLLPGFAFASVPQVAPEARIAALTYSAIALFGNVGTFLGTPIFAASREMTGWWGGAIFIAAMSAVGTALAALLSSLPARR